MDSPQVPQSGIESFAPNHEHDEDVLALVRQNQQTHPFNQSLIDGSRQEVSIILTASEKIKRLTMEQVEALKELTFRKLEITSENVEECSDLKAMQELHDANLVPDHLLRGFLIGHTDPLVDSGAAGFLDRFASTDKESPHYYPGYRSAHTQVVQDSLRNPKPEYNFQMYGLFNNQGKLAGYVSMRLPPSPPSGDADAAAMAEYTEALDSYRKYLRASLRLDNQPYNKEVDTNPLDKMTFRPEWQQDRTENDIAHDPINICELDSICVDRTYPGASLLLIANMLRSLKEELGHLPGHYVAYFLSGLITEGEDSHSRSASFPNKPSRTLLEDKLKGVEMANRFTLGEAAVREIDGSIVTIPHSWTYVQMSIKYMVPSLEARMIKMGIMKEGETLFDNEK